MVYLPDKHAGRMYVLVGSMTIDQTLRTIRDMGLTAKWKVDTQEYRINFKQGTESTAYYTNDSADAIGTAQYMLTEKDSKK